MTCELAQIRKRMKMLKWDCSQFSTSNCHTEFLLFYLQSRIYFI